jgi:flagellar M-ring protein FliF
MQFTAPPNAGTVAEAGSFDFLAVNAVSLLQMAFLGIVAMVLGLFVIKPILTTQAAPQLGDLSGRAGALDAAMGEVSGPGTGVAGDGEIELNPEVLAVVSADQQKVEHLRQTIADRADDSKAILEDWLNTTELKSEEA